MLPQYLNILGYIIATFAMIGSLCISLKFGRIAFKIWMVTNSYELFVTFHYYHNYWLSAQFAFYLINAFIGLYFWRDKANVII